MYVLSYLTLIAGTSDGTLKVSTDSGSIAAHIMRTNHTTIKSKTGPIHISIPKDDKTTMVVVNATTCLTEEEVCMYVCM